MPVFHNVEVKWVNHIKPDQYGNLTMDMVVDSEQEMDLVDLGLKVRSEDGKAFYRFSYSPTTRDGTAITIPIYDRFGREFTSRVPNGAKMDVDFYTYDWEFGGKTGVKARVKGAKLLEDVKPESGLEFDIPEGE